MNGRNRALRQAGDPIRPWEEIVVDAVGDVIEFWGFKRNQGRVWAMLYLRGEALAATEIQSVLGLSKGAVSMLTTELEQWGIIDRYRPRGETSFHYAAKTDLMQMIGDVIRRRESGLIKRVRQELDDAVRAAVEADAADDVVDRVRRMRTLAALAEQAVELFLQTARFDVHKAIGVLNVKKGRRP